MTPPFFGLGPVLGGSASLGSRPLSAEVAAYQETTGISTSSARVVDRMLSEARACGIEPAFFWVGGAAYNQTDQRVAVIGGTAALVGPGSHVPVGEGAGCRFNRGKFFEFDNPSSVKGAALSELVLLLWVTPQSNDESHRVFSTYTSTERGFDVTLAAPTRAMTIGTYPSAMGAVNNIAQNGSTFNGLQGTRVIALDLKPASAGKWVLDAQYNTASLVTLYNNHAKLYLGGLGLGYTVGQPYAFANVIVHAAMLAPAMTASMANSYRAANIPFTAGHLSAIETPELVCTGDSVTAAKWNAQLANGTLTHGGAWAGRLALQDHANGGTSLDWHIAYTDLIVNSLSSRAYGTKYFYYCPEGMEPSIAASLGIAATDEAWRARTLEFILDIETRTGATVILGGYIRGNVAVEPDQAHNEYWAALAADRGWTWVPFEDDPHAAVYTGAVPGTYGFYSDSIHQTTAGCRIQAEMFAAVVPHPYHLGPQAVYGSPPVVTGTEASGSLLSCTEGTWLNSPTGYTYQWLRNLAAISGATASTYTLQAADVGNRIACRVTATKAGMNSASFTSAPTGAIA